MHNQQTIIREDNSMSKKRKLISALLFIGLALVCIVGAFLTGPPGGEKESIKEAMKDAVLHEENKVMFGPLEVNPAFLSAVTITVVILTILLIIRIFVIPGFRYIPGKFQMLLELWVGWADDLAKKNSPHRNGFLGAYVFAAGSYVFISTMFELFGVQWVTTSGMSISLPAPITDINAAIAMGVMSYGVIMSGGIAGNGIKGVFLTLKDFSLPISMSFRLFGALLSGLLVTDLVYHYIHLSFVLPVAVGLMFTVLHAIVQTYVLTMLTALFYGEVSEKVQKKSKEKKAGKTRKVKTA